MLEGPIAARAELADLFWGAQASMRSAIEAGDLQAAWRARMRADEYLPKLQPRDPEVRRYRQVVNAFDAELQGRGREALAQLRLQRVLAAAELLRPALVGELGLRSRFFKLLGDDLDFAPAWELSSAELPALPESLAIGRQVRFSRSGKLELGQVIQASPQRATLRLRTSAGLLYPEVDLHRLGLVNPSRAEALDQAVRCLHAADALSASLWLELGRQSGMDLGAPWSGLVQAIESCLNR